MLNLSRLKIFGFALTLVAAAVTSELQKREVREAVDTAVDKAVEKALAARNL